MKNNLFALMIAGGLSLIGVRAYAHHSFAATYFEDQKVTVHGKLVQFLYRNPHSFVHVEGGADKGETQTWPGGRAGRHPRNPEAGRRWDRGWKSGTESRGPPAAHGEPFPSVRRLEVGRHVR